jgi:predicted SAM-dependent methyltransferase
MAGQGTPLLLHIGCGARVIPGFIHVDTKALPHIDHVTRAENLDFAESNSVDLIYCSHLLEHYDRRHFTEPLREWLRVLRPGGVLRLSVPDFAACAKIYYEEGLADGLNGVVGLIVGGQRDEYDFHKMVFDEPFLTAALLQVGFNEVRRWDWRTTSHSHIDDYSQAYLPHMDKENGLQMSLNLEAVK